MRKLLLKAVASTAFMLAGEKPKPEPEFIANGKQVLRRGQHFADCASPEIAEALVHVLLGEVLLPLDLDKERQDWVQKVIWP